MHSFLKAYQNMRMVQSKCDKDPTGSNLKFKEYFEELCDKEHNKIIQFIAQHRVSSKEFSEIFKLWFLEQEPQKLYSTTVSGYP